MLKKSLAVQSFLGVCIYFATLLEEVPPILVKCGKCVCPYFVIWSFS